MAASKKSRYITIPYEGTKPEWLGGVSTEEMLAANGTNLGSLGKASISYSLTQIGEEFGNPVTLLVDYGEGIVRNVRACKDAGLKPCLPFTEDRKDEVAHKFAHESLLIGDTFSENLFKNSHAVLEAAAQCDAKIILFTDPTLAGDEYFLGLAENRNLKVFKAMDPLIPDTGWIVCAPTVALKTESSWRKCPSCSLLFDDRGLAVNHYVCPSCGTYYRMSSLERIKDLLDAGSFVEWFSENKPKDPLGFPGYAEKLNELRGSTGLDEAVRCGRGNIAGLSFALCIMDSQFLMGSMGTIVGEKITRTIERATEENLPLLICSASGGARMQEGLASLMQMAKISAALARHDAQGLLYISLITDPTTGGVSASFAMLGDIILAEPKALIGFAGQRVIKDTIKRELPEGFQTAEFALEHGLIDAIVDRKDLRDRIAHILALHAGVSHGDTDSETLVSYAAVCENLASGRGTYNTVTYGMLPQIRRIFLAASQKIKAGSGRSSRLGQRSRQKKGRESTARLDVLLHGRRVDADEGVSLEEALQPEEYNTYDGSNPAWKSVQLARNTKRPTACYYVDSFVDGFIELHGDRAFADDRAIRCGIGWIGTRPVTVITQEKGDSLKERIARNFGCPQPEGYRKSLRLMRQAEKFGRPVICLVDTQGAFCGMEAEERGQANAIAENLAAMASLKVPTISVLIGEGGSGGALALALADRVAMQQNAVYSVLSPEGFASILWKDGSRAPEAAAVMKMSAKDAYDMGIVDTVLSEGEEAAHLNPEIAAACVRSYLVKTLAELDELSFDELLATRYARFRKF